jgi:hypothetical protein
MWNGMLRRAGMVVFHQGQKAREGERMRWPWCRASEKAEV